MESPIRPEDRFKSQEIYKKILNKEIIFESTSLSVLRTARNL